MNDPDTLSPNIRVLLRVRPLNTRELHHSSHSILHIENTPDEGTVNIVDGNGYGSGLETVNVGNNGGPKSFTFDAVYGPESNQVEVFDGVKGIVDAVCEGYNGTIVAYGQTGSGKTHTIFGEEGL
jgi:excinuclease UvrABC helicase subunit UvrB